MKKPIYIFSHGKIKREANTLVFTTEEKKTALPVETISEIFVFSEITINKRLLEFLTQKHIPMHFFNRYGYYIGTYYPREHMNSGLMTLRQAEHCLNEEWRLGLARAFVYGAMKNMLFNLKVYSSRGKPVSDPIASIEKIIGELNSAQSPTELMALEGHAREIYYASFDAIIENPDFCFERRSRRPPENRLNALISFGNSLLYVTVLSEIYRTHLDPRIGFLHETNERSFTLNLDIAEVFKPIIVDRVIFSLINRKEIKARDFCEELEGIYMNRNCKKIFVESYNSRLSETITHRKLKRKVSYRRLIRLECYKLYKHFLGEEVYTPFIMKR